MIGKLDGDHLSACAAWKHRPVQHLDGTLGFSAQVKSHKADTLRQTCVKKTNTAV